MNCKDKTEKTRKVKQGEASTRGEQRSVDYRNSGWYVQQCVHVGNTFSGQVHVDTPAFHENKHEHVCARPSPDSSTSQVLLQVSEPAILVFIVIEHRWAVVQPSEVLAFSLTR